ncbi:MAG: response regulator [Leeuwenhoekiella sp.]
MKKISLACIIDDDPVHVFLSKKSLMSSGRVENIMVCSNGKEAYDKLHPLVMEGSGVPELILLDLNMPIWDGWQFLEEFAKLPLKQEIKIFIVTSSINKEDRERAKEFSKVNHFFVKPVDQAALVQFLDESD